MNLSLSTSEDVRLNMVLSATDSDGDALTYQLVSNATSGALINSSGVANELTYVPTANFNGTDSFTYKVSDGKTFSNVATVTINVTPVYDPISTIPARITAPVSQNSVGGEVLSSVKAVDSPSLTFSITQNPTYGSVTINAQTGQFNYLRSQEAYFDKIQYSVTDGISTAVGTLVIEDPNSRPLLSVAVKTPGMLLIPEAYVATKEVRPDGTIYVRGTFTTTASADFIPHGNGMFIARLGADSRVVWGHVFYHANKRSGFNVTVTQVLFGANDLYLAGELEKGGTLNSTAPLYDSFLATTNGAYLVAINQATGSIGYIRNEELMMPAKILLERPEGQAVISCASNLSFTYPARCLALDGGGVVLWQSNFQLPSAAVNFASSKVLSAASLEVTGNFAPNFTVGNGATSISSGACSKYYDNSTYRCGFTAVFDLLTGAPTSLTKTD